MRIDISIADNRIQSRVLKHRDILRLFTALNSAYDALRDAQQALANNLPADLVSEDLRRILHHLGEITGDITSDDILHTIFSTFCIGK